MTDHQPTREGGRLVTAAGISRLIGALITVWLVLLAAPSLTDGQWLRLVLLILVGCPAIAAVFSLPRPSFRSYLAIGLAIALCIGVLRGVRLALDSTVSNDVSKSAEFFIGFLLSAFLSILGLVIAGLVFALLRTSIGMIVQPKPDRTRVDELRKWIALVLPLAAIPVWILIGGQAILSVLPLVAGLVSLLYIWPRKRNGSSVPS
jgi:O-antigen ligase